MTELEKLAEEYWLSKYGAEDATVSEDSFKAGFQAALQSDAVRGLLEAVEFYADGEGNVLDWDGVNNPAYIQDRGKTARKALAKFKELK